MHLYSARLGKAANALEYETLKNRQKILKQNFESLFHILSISARRTCRPVPSFVRIGQKLYEEKKIKQEVWPPGRPTQCPIEVGKGILCR